MLPGSSQKVSSELFSSYLSAMPYFDDLNCIVKTLEIFLFLFLLLF